MFPSISCGKNLKCGFDTTHNLICILFTYIDHIRYIFSCHFNFKNFIQRNSYSPVDRHKVWMYASVKIHILTIFIKQLSREKSVSKYHPSILFAWRIELNDTEYSSNGQHSMHTINRALLPIIIPQHLHVEGIPITVGTSISKRGRGESPHLYHYTNMAISPMSSAENSGFVLSALLTSKSYPGLSLANLL